YSGNVGRCHDMETIFHTAQLLAQEENIQFVCIGSGAKIDVLRQNVAEMKLNNFFFLPYQHKSTGKTENIVSRKYKIKGGISSCC
ncbi:MAG: hypothetical protein ACKO9S_04695, partial [Bacteroidota bacterium]